MIPSLRMGLATAAARILVLLVDLFVLEEEAVAPPLLLPPSLRTKLYCGNMKYKRSPNTLMTPLKQRC